MQRGQIGSERNHAVLTSSSLFAYNVPHSHKCLATGYLSKKNSPQMSPSVLRSAKTCFASRLRPTAALYVLYPNLACRSHAPFRHGCKQLWSSNARISPLVCDNRIHLTDGSFLYSLYSNPHNTRFRPSRLSIHSPRSKSLVTDQPACRLHVTPPLSALGTLNALLLPSPYSGDKSRHLQ